MRSEFVYSLEQVSENKVSLGKYFFTTTKWLN